MNLYLIRHQSTIWNREGKLQGRFDGNDILRDAEFYSRVQRNKELISEIQNPIVCSSPMLRVRSTAEEYGYKNFNIENDLQEYDFGIWEGKLKTDLLRSSGDSWLNNFTNFKGGESFLKLKSRIDKVLEKYSTHENVIFFTHGVVCRYIICRSNNLGFDEMNKLNVENNELISIKIQ